MSALEKFRVIHGHSRLSDMDRHLFNEGSHFDLYEKMGAHVGLVDGRAGVHFAVWAPDARHVNVMGDFNGWDRHAHALMPSGSTGIWEGFIAGLGPGTAYKYFIQSRHGGHSAEKSDPYAFHAETPPKTASKVWPLDYKWGDSAWMKRRAASNAWSEPVSIYELHPGSWRRVSEENNRPLTYREMGVQLAEWCHRTGFTHVELMPVMEHPFDPSWGYQVTGFFAPTSRFGTPQDFMAMIDHLHQQGIGVILDWVPSHFPADGHGLALFDGTHLYEHADPRKGFHPDWNSCIFNYGRNEVRAFLISSALFWLDKYHVDGLRIDAVASMLYLDYSRKAGEWIPNVHGGKENLEAIDLLRRLNAEVYSRHPGAQTIAEESTAFPMVSRPAYLGGLGFGFKWDMGWMHDTLRYMSKEPVHRKFHHNDLTFRMLYSYHENFVLSLSHDEVVHGKGSLITRMPGDWWQKFASLRALYGWMWSQPGKKLLFMGDEFAQWNEWNHATALDWNLLGWPAHEGMVRWVADLNRFYSDSPSMHQLDCDPAGFEWLDCNDAEQSVISFQRKDREGRPVVWVFNFTPVPRHDYHVGVDRGGRWRERLNSDASLYGGSGMGNQGSVMANEGSAHGRSHSVSLLLPPLAALALEPDDR